MTRLARLAIPLGALGLLVLWAWILGAGQVPFVSPLVEPGYLVTGEYWDAQAAAMLQGGFAVPCDTLKGEAFVMERGCYGYFGVTPSLLRIPMNVLCPSCAGGWSRVAMLAGGTLSALFALLIAMRMLPQSGGRLIPAAAFALMVAASSSLTFIVGNPFPYHEAILWASAFALGTLWAMMLWRDTGSLWTLAAMLLFCALTLNARVTVGLGVAGAVGLTLLAAFLRGSIRRPWAAAVLVVLGCTIASPLAVNLAKFGQISPPFERHVIYQSAPERLARVQSGAFKLQNLACTLRAYLSPAVDRFPQFPWIIPTFSWVPGEPMPEEIAYCATAEMENIEPYYALYYTFPALLVLCVLGWLAPVTGRAWRWRATALPALGAAAAAGPTFLFATLTYRYLHDVFPLVVMGAAAGLAALAEMPRPARRAALAVVALAAIVGFYLNVTAALTHGFSQPETLAALGQMQRLFPWVIR